MKFDPNAAATADSGIFGLPFDEKESALLLYPVPWEATTSYGGGTGEGPAAILEASRQVDLYDADVLKPYEAGLHMLPENREIRSWNVEAKALAARVIDAAGVTQGDRELEAALQAVNAASERVNLDVERATQRILSGEKIPGIVGGDHSVPFGALKAIAGKNPSFGILHFDAHLDLRNAYEGFQWSHASIMHNVLERIPAVSKLVQVGIRDFCEEEMDYARSQGARVRVFTDRELTRRKFQGASWDQVAREIVEQLPKEVWVSFDIDGLDPRYCPHTGTPVPGGLEFQEANYILSLVVQSGRKIIGFDLNEVAPHPEWPEGGDEWDANVGARMLYKLCAWTLASQGKAKAIG